MSFQAAVLHSQRPEFLRKGKGETEKMEHTFMTQRTGTGTHEWAEETFSFEVGCEVGCHYCWAREGMLRRKVIETPEAWLTPRTNLKKIDKGWRKHDGVIMFPGTHNISPRNIENSLKILRNMAAAGNSILITIKPSREIVRALTTALMSYQKQILFRFSIGSNHNHVLASWEPHGPSFDDRYNALQVAFHAGFKTSVSAEPLLGGIQTAIALMKLTKPYVTHDLWFGFMRNIERRVVTAPALIDGRTPMPIDEIRFLHSGPTAMLLERLAAHNSEWIRLKDSVRTSAEAFKREMLEKMREEML